MALAQTGMLAPKGLTVGKICVAVDFVVKTTAFPTTRAPATEGSKLVVGVL